MELSPAFVGNLVWGGWIDVSAGNVERALSRFKTANRLSPQSAARALTLTGMGVCLLGLVRISEAYTLLKEAVQELPHHPMTLAAITMAAQLAGKPDDAVRFFSRLEKHGGIEPLLHVITDPQYRRMVEGALNAVKAHRTV